MVGLPTILLGDTERDNNNYYNYNNYDDIVCENTAGTICLSAGLLAAACNYYTKNI